MKEVDKIVEVKQESLLLSDFLDWLTENQYHICVWKDVVLHSAEIGDYSPKGFYPKSISNERLLADFFKIDLEKVEQERMQILDELRKELK